eukprot:scaffold31023_cov20-Prasinocladus_malaysianus.AAC.1
MEALWCCKAYFTALLHHGSRESYQRSLVCRYLLAALSLAASAGERQHAARNFSRRRRQHGAVFVRALIV